MLESHCSWWGWKQGVECAVRLSFLLHSQAQVYTGHVNISRNASLSPPCVLHRQISCLMRVCVTCLAVSDCLWLCALWPTRPLCPWDTWGENTGVGYHSLLQGIFRPRDQTPSPASSGDSLPVSHQGSPVSCIFYHNLKTGKKMIRSVKPP